MTNQEQIKCIAEIKTEAQGPLTPRSIFLAAYNKMWSTENHDNLQAVAERLLKGIEEKDIDKWEFKSVANMERFLIGCVKREQVKTLQKHDVALKDSLQDVIDEIPDYKRIPQIDLFDDIRGAKKKGTKKDLFVDHEKDLITWYLEHGQTIRQIAKKLDTPRMTIKRQLDSIFRRITKLPIRGLYGWVESQGVSRRVAIDQPNSQPLVTHIGLLKRYRRTKDVRWLDKYSEHVESVLERHACRCLNDDHGGDTVSSRQLAVAPAVGSRVSITDRAQLNQSILNLYHHTPYNGLTLSSLTV